MLDHLQRTRYPSRQKELGQALILLLLLLGLGAGMFVFSMAGNMARTAERANTDVLALAQAKEALIGYAASRGDSALNYTGSGTRPGELPCPDTTGDGSDSGSCTAGLIGRLPWKTLGMREPKDASGETLWYAVAGPFRRYNASTTPITSDTVGNMTVYANSTATTSTTRAVAVIFAPGLAIGSQQRGAASATCATTGTTIANNLCAANYLDSTGGVDNAINNGPFISAATSTSSFNDRVLFITAADLMPAVERRVANEMIALLTQYKAAAGGYPWADASTGNSTQGYSHWRMPCGTALPSNWGADGTPVLPAWLTNGCGSPPTGWTGVIYYAASRLEFQAPGQCNTCTDNYITVDGNNVKLVLITPGADTGSPARVWPFAFGPITGYFEDSANTDKYVDNNDTFVTPSSANYPHRTNHDRIFIIP